MLKEKMVQLGDEPSAIRELFAYGLKRKAEIGADKVFDFSIGSPSVPAPEQVRDTIMRLMNEDPVAVHAYTPAGGDPKVCQAVADYIAKEYGIPAKAKQVYLTSGAAAGLAITIEATTNPGAEVIVVSPYFPEYKTWIDQSKAKIVEVPAALPDFSIDIEAMKAAINENTAAIILNSPNNPVGSVYSRENLEAFAKVLTEKEEEFGSQIFIIADEPYRQITYGAEVPYIPSIYDDTIVCYSFSKSLSLPGERIGYIYVNNLMKNADEVALAINGAGRALGYICAPTLFQRVLEECIAVPSNVEAYDTNRKLLTDALGKMGYEYVEPQGAFYLWVKALEDDAQAFSDKAKEFELLLVPSDSFGCGGWVRVSYCIAKETIENSLPAFEALMESYK